ACLHTIAAEHALGYVDIELARVPSQGKGLIFGADDFDAVGGAGDLAQIATHAPLSPVIVTQQREGPSVGVRNRPLFSRILKSDGAMEHVCEGDLHRVPDLAEHHRVQQLFCQHAHAHEALPLRSLPVPPPSHRGRDGWGCYSFSIVTSASLK